MKQALLLAGAVALGIASPAIAKPGNGHGQGHGQAYGYGYGYAHQGGHGYEAEDDGDDDGGYNNRGGIGYGVGGCPPGLAKKNNGCMPPGLARKMQQQQQQALAVGQRYIPGYGYTPYGYNQIPYDIRNQYGLNPYNNYYYNNGNLYGVDPRTMLIQQVIGALIR